MALELILLIIFVLNFVLSVKIVKQLEVTRECIKEINAVVYSKYFGDSSDKTE